LQITIWTIEHSIRTINEFLELLEEYGIQTVVDVRRFPTSKIEHFKKEQMEKWVQKHELDYFWLGKELGGYRHGGYKRYMRTKLFRTGIAQLLEIAIADSFLHILKEKALK